jgi:hypothetical protein
MLARQVATTEIRSCGKDRQADFRAIEIVNSLLIFAYVHHRVWRSERYRVIQETLSLLEHQMQRRAWKFAPRWIDANHRRESAAAAGVPEPVISARPWLQAACDEDLARG